MKADLYFCPMWHVVSPTPGACIECGGELWKGEFIWSKKVSADLFDQAAEIARLRATLEFYAERDNYEWKRDDDMQHVPLVDADGGRKAREAIAKVEK